MFEKGTMKMNKHTATLPDGKIATRNSKSRVYSHVVAIGPEKAALRADSYRRSIEYKLEEIARYVATIETLKTATARKDNRGRLVFSGQSVAWSDSTDVEISRIETIAKYTGWINGLNGAIENLEAAIEKLENGPELVGGWDAVSWASRLDLATKAASSLGNPYGCEIRIIAASH
jgi:hypothetical protein